MYVTSILPEKNQVVLGPEGSQYADSLTASDVNWIAFEPPAPGETIACEAGIRYHATPAPCSVHILEGGAPLCEVFLAPTLCNAGAGCGLLRW